MDVNDKEIRTLLVSASILQALSGIMHALAHIADHEPLCEACSNGFAMGFEALDELVVGLNAEMLLLQSEIELKDRRN